MERIGNQVDLVRNICQEIRPDVSKAIERAILFVLVLERSLEPKFVLDDRAADRRIELPQFQSFVGRNDAESSILRRDVVARPAGALVDLEQGAVKLIAALFRDDADL